MPSPDFSARLARAVRLALREMRDGCVDCRLTKGKGFCGAHQREAYELATNPRASPRLKGIIGMADRTPRHGESQL